MKIANKKVTAEMLVRDALEKAKHFADYNIFTFLNEEGALKKAREIDAKIARGEEVGRLAGVPYALKDNFLSPEGQTTASSHILEGFVSPVTATAVEKLETEGAIMIGRTNMDAFAHGSSTENSYFGPTHNAKDFEPASFNGVYGLKPTYGTISRYGVVAMASSTDCIGFFTKTPDDMDLLMEITSGQDPKDMTTLPDYYNNNGAWVPSEPVKVGIIKDFDNNSVHPEIRKALQEKVDLLKSKGHKIVELTMPALKYALAAYYIIVPAEVASNLSRYDGVRYGFRSEKSEDLDALYKNTRGEGFMPENKRRIMIGNFVLSSGFYDAYFLKAAKARTLIVKEYEKAFEKCDFILSPVTPNPAFKLGEKTSDPVEMYLGDAMTVPLNLAGVPGLTIPAGETKGGVALGLQLIGPRRSDKSLIEFTKELV